MQRKSKNKEIQDNMLKTHESTTEECKEFTKMDSSNDSSNKFSRFPSRDYELVEEDHTIYFHSLVDLAYDIIHAESMGDVLFSNMQIGNIFWK